MKLCTLEDVEKIRESGQFATITHGLKTLPEHFQAVWNGTKNYEIRYDDDRLFRVGEQVVLYEMEGPQKEGCQPTYTGRRIRAVITYKLKGVDGLHKAYCILSISEIMRVDSPVTWQPGRFSVW